MRRGLLTLGFLAALALAAAPAQGFFIILEEGSGEAAHEVAPNPHHILSAFFSEPGTSSVFAPLLHPLSWLEEQLEAMDALQQSTFEDMLIQRLEAEEQRDPAPQEVEDEMLHHVGCHRFADAMKQLHGKEPDLKVSGSADWLSNFDIELEDDDSDESEVDAGTTAASAVDEAAWADDNADARTDIVDLVSVGDASVALRGGAAWGARGREEAVAEDAEGQGEVAQAISSLLREVMDQAGDSMGHSTHSISHSMGQGQGQMRAAREPYMGEAEQADGQHMLPFMQAHGKRSEPFMLSHEQEHIMAPDPDTMHARMDFTHGHMDMDTMHERIDLDGHSVYSEHVHMHEHSHTFSQQQQQHEESLHEDKRAGGQGHGMSFFGYSIVPLRGASSEGERPAWSEQHVDMISLDQMQHGGVRSGSSGSGSGSHVDDFFDMQEDEDYEMFLWPDEPPRMHSHLCAQLLDQLMLLRSIFWPLGGEGDGAHNPHTSHTSAASTRWSLRGSGAILAWQEVRPGLMQDLLLPEHFSEDDLAASLADNVDGSVGIAPVHTAAAAAEAIPHRMSSQAGSHIGAEEEEELQEEQGWAAWWAGPASLGSLGSGLLSGGRPTWLDLDGDGRPEVELSLYRSNGELNWRLLLLGALLLATAFMAAAFMRALLQLRCVMSRGGSGFGGFGGCPGHVLVPVTLERDGQLVRGLMLLPEEECGGCEGVDGSAGEKGFGAGTGTWQLASPDKSGVKGCSVNEQACVKDCALSCVQDCGKVQEEGKVKPEGQSAAEEEGYGVVVAAQVAAEAQPQGQQSKQV